MAAREDRPIYWGGGRASRSAEPSGAEWPASIADTRAPGKSRWMWPDAAETQRLLRQVEQADSAAADALWERHRPPSGG